MCEDIAGLASKNNNTNRNDRIDLLDAKVREMLPKGVN
jgi:hypothetical protein